MGKQTMTHAHSGRTLEMVQTSCDQCKGMTDFEIHYSDPCPRCGGNGWHWTDNNGHGIQPDAITSFYL